MKEVKYIFVDKTSRGFSVYAKNYNTGTEYLEREYIGYTKKEAVKDYKEYWDLKGYKVM